MKLPELKELFPFEYQGGGYFRKRDIPIGKNAEILHGEQAVKFLYDQIEKHLKELTSPIKCSKLVS